MSNGPVEPEHVLRARERFDALAPLHVEPQDGFYVWHRQRRILVRRVEADRSLSDSDKSSASAVWCVAWFEADGFLMREGFVSHQRLANWGFPSIFVYADALSDMLDIFQPQEPRSTKPLSDSG